MKITEMKISINELTNGYLDSGDNGVVGFGGLLDIRPPYQREFVYNEKQRNEVINTVLKGFPLNVMYWVLKEDNTFEILDGQQRTLSICQFVNNDFSFKEKYFHNLTQTERDIILNYELMIFVCEGNDLERLEWFRVINEPGAELSAQELRNANYTGAWLMDAKRHFSKKDNPAKGLFDKFMKVKWVRQEGLETALEWIANSQNTTIELYMAKHQFDLNCNDLWFYFNNVVTWTTTIFKTYRSEMKGLPWGIYYNKYSHLSLDPNTVDKRVNELMLDSEVENKKGIYEYIFDGKEKHLNLRTFNEDIRREVYEKQNGICPHCKKPYDIGEMHADHIKPWSKGGKTVIENCQMLCADCNRVKSNI